MLKIVDCQATYQAWLPRDASTGGNQEHLSKATIIQGGQDDLKRSFQMKPPGDKEVLRHLIRHMNAHPLEAVWGLLSNITDLVSHVLYCSQVPSEGIIDPDAS